MSTPQRCRHEWTVGSLDHICRFFEGHSLPHTCLCGIPETDSETVSGN